LEPSEEELAGLHGRVAALGQAVLDRDDVDAVRESLGRTLGTNVTREDVAALKRYEFDSDSNVLTAENLVAWRRLAAGTPTRDDLRFFVQQWHELQALRESNVSFDPTTHHGQAPSFGRWYVPAHQAGLVAEMRFLAANLGAQLGRPVTWEQVARSDRERREEFLPALARARGADLPAPEHALPDLDALDAQFEDDYDDELRDALRGWKRQPAGRTRQRTQVFTYLHGLQSSPRGADYWRDVGFERVETQVGPVWADPRNADAAREALGAFDADAPTHTTWLADMAEARAVAVPVVLPSREQIIALHDQLPALVAGFNYDNIDGALSIAARQPDLAGKAAALVHALVHGHTFNDANKRTGNAVLDWIVAHNRGGTGLLDSARGLLGRATAIASTAESVGQELRDLVPHAGLGEGA
jgi:Fic/DOC family